MNISSSRRQIPTAAVVVAGAAGLLGSALMLSAPAGAEPPVPPNVWIQCSSFSGPNQTFPHPLGGCIARGEPVSYTHLTLPTILRV